MKDQTPGERAITLALVVMLGLLASYWGRKPEAAPSAPVVPVSTRDTPPTRARESLPEPEPESESELESGQESGRDVAPVETAANPPRAADFDFYLLTLSW